MVVDSEQSQEIHKSVEFNLMLEKFSEGDQTFKLRAPGCYLHDASCPATLYMFCISLALFHWLEKNKMSDSPCPSFG